MGVLQILLFLRFFQYQSEATDKSVHTVKTAAVFKCIDLQYFRIVWLKLFIHFISNICEYLSEKLLLPSHWMECIYLILK